MSNGLSIINLDSGVLIDDKYTSYAVDSITTVTCSNAAYGPYTPSSGGGAQLPLSYFSDNQQLLAVRKVADPNDTLNLTAPAEIDPNNTMVLNGLSTGYVSLPGSPGQVFSIVNLKKSDIINLPYPSSGQGLVVYRDTGGVSFSSSYPLFRVVKAFSTYVTPNTSSTSSYTFNYTNSIYNKPVYAIISAGSSIQITNTTYCYFKVTGISYSSSQCTFTLSKYTGSSGNTPVSPYQSVKFTISIGYII